MTTTLALWDGREAQVRIDDSGRIGWSDRWELMPDLLAAGVITAIHGGPGTYCHTDYTLNEHAAYLLCRDCGLAFPLMHTEAEDVCSYADNGHHPSGGELIVVAGDPAAAPSCATLDLEPLASHRAARRATPTSCPLCGQTSVQDEQLVCPHCKRAADLRAGGTQQHLFTPLRPQLRGQEGLF